MQQNLAPKKNDLKHAGFELETNDETRQITLTIQLCRIEKLHRSRRRLNDKYHLLRLVMKAADGWCLFVRP